MPLSTPIKLLAFIWTIDSLLGFPSLTVWKYVPPKKERRGTPKTSWVLGDTAFSRSWFPSHTIKPISRCMLALCCFLHLGALGGDVYWMMRDLEINTSNQDPSQNLGIIKRLIHMKKSEEWMKCFVLLGGIFISPALSLIILFPYHWTSSPPTTLHSTASYWPEDKYKLDQDSLSVDKTSTLVYIHLATYCMPVLQFLNRIGKDMMVGSF